MRHLAVLLTLWLSGVTEGYAWGDQGHRITGYIAESNLTPSARSRLVSLLGSEDLAQISTWMDDERGDLAERLPGSPRWHYENRAACGTSTHTCDGGNCVTARIEYYRTVLKDTQRSRQMRAEAVRMLVHLIGDLHQPLHLADNTDRGGNDLYVLVPRERDPRRLHEVWDSRLLRMDMGRRSAEHYAKSLLAHAAPETALDVNVERWATNSYRLGVDVAYGMLPGFACGSVRLGTQGNPVKLDDEYMSRARTVVTDQLLNAGLHIALVLNEALGKS